MASSLYESLPSLLAATVAFAIGTSVVLRDRNRDEFVLFAVFCFNLGLFHLARFFHDFSGVALFGWGAQTIALVLPWSADRCFASLVPREGDRPRGRVRTILLALLLIAQTIAFSRSSAAPPSPSVNFRTTHGSSSRSGSMAT